MTVPIYNNAEDSQNQKCVVNNQMLIKGSINVVFVTEMKIKLSGYFYKHLQSESCQIKAPKTKNQIQSLENKLTCQKFLQATESRQLIIIGIYQVFYLV